MLMVELLLGNYISSSLLQITLTPQYSASLDQPAVLIVPIVCGLAFLATVGVENKYSTMLPVPRWSTGKTALLWVRLWWVLTLTAKREYFSHF